MRPSRTYRAATAPSRRAARPPCILKLFATAAFVGADATVPFALVAADPEDVAAELGLELILLAEALALAVAVLVLVFDEAVLEAFALAVLLALALALALATVCEATVFFDSMTN